MPSFFKEKKKSKNGCCIYKRRKKYSKIIQNSRKEWNRKQNKPKKKKNWKGEEFPKLPLKRPTNNSHEHGLGEKEEWREGGRKWKGK